MNAPANPMTTRFEGPAPEAEVTRHMLKRGVFAVPVLVAIAGFIWGADGALGCLYGMALVFVNFALAAGLISLTARISLALMMGAVLFGYLARLGLIFLAVILVRDAGWISLTALGLTIIVTHLGLLVWEMRYVAASLAFPALKPKKNS